MAKVSVKGIVLGGVTDIVATIVLTIPLVIYVIIDELRAAPNASLEAVVMAAIRANPILYGLQSLIGLACSVLGGYVAARVAGHDELLNGLLASVLSLGFGIYSLADSKNAGSLLLPVLLLIVSPVCSMLGGQLRLLQSRAGASLRFHGRREGGPLQQVSADAVAGEQIQSVRPALDSSPRPPSQHNQEVRSSGASWILRAFLWTTVLKAFFWIITLLVIAAVVSHLGIDLFDLSKKLLRTR